MNFRDFLPLLDIQPLPAVFVIALVSLVVIGIALTKIPRR